jgi:hypothetical protein
MTNAQYSVPSFQIKSLSSVSKDLIRNKLMEIASDGGKLSDGNVRFLRKPIGKSREWMSGILNIGGCVSSYFRKMEQQPLRAGRPCDPRARELG